MAECALPLGMEPIEVGPILGIDYLTAYYCSWQDHHFLFSLFLASYIAGLIWTLGNTANNYLSPTLSKVCERLNLSYNVAGVTFLAFGNGAPDVFTQIAAMSSLNENTALLGLNTVLGSSMFVVTIVVGTVAILSPCHVSSKIFLRDVSFHIIAVSTVAFVGITGKVTLWGGIFLLGIYFSYVGVVLLIAEREARLASSAGKNAAPKRMGELTPVAGGLVVRTLGSDLQTAFWHTSASTSTSASSSSSSSSTTKSSSKYGGPNANKWKTSAGPVGAKKSGNSSASASASASVGYTFLVLDEEDTDSDDDVVSFTGNSASISRKKEKVPGAAIDDGTITLSGGLLNATFDGEIIEDYVGQIIGMSVGCILAIACVGSVPCYVFLCAEGSYWECASHVQ